MKKYRVKFLEISLGYLKKIGEINSNNHIKMD